jgi:hypothetical protein
MSTVATFSATLAEMVFDVPRRVEAQLIGQFDLLDGFRVGLLLSLSLPVRVGFGPRPGYINLVKKVEFHNAPSAGLRHSVFVYTDEVSLNKNNADLSTR